MPNDSDFVVRNNSEQNKEEYMAEPTTPEVLEWMKGLEPSQEPVKAPKTPRAKNARERSREQREARYERQEAARAPKVQIDQKLTLYIWIIGISIAFIASAIVSYNGITAVAEFVGLTVPWMGGLFFFFIELMYLLFLVAYLILASRVREDGKKERTFGAILGMVGFGLVAVVANAFHTINYWDYDFLEPRMWAGLLLAVSAPLAIISASKMASRVVFAKAISI
jgi:hypothetical protein